jgi:aminopeptidase
VQLVVEEAYKAKASKVIVEWNYQPLAKIHVRYQSLKTLGTVPEWQKARRQHMVDTVPVRIHIISEDPDGLKGMNMTKLAKSRQMTYPILKPYADQLEGKQQWTIAAVPGKAWAKKVFPGERTSVAVEKLWEAIISTSRVNADPIKAWEDHNLDLRKRCEYLNSLGIAELHYTADNGTDLTVGMIPDAMFCGGAEVSRQDITFNPNIPTEECFISPMRGKAEGIVYSTKPLCYQGQIIDNFYFRFKDGKVVEAKAEKGEELLNTLISMDEGAAYLGECALVPQSSPINQSGLLFYNTLFDENAVCHLAVGMGFADTIRDHHNKTIEECRKLGINDSMVHEDFMIGCDSMSIDAKTFDGKVVPIFRNGTWAF